MSVSGYKQSLNDAIAARKAGNFTDALEHVQIARMELAKIADGGASGFNVAYNREQLASIEHSLSRSRSRSTGIKRTGVEYKRVTD